MSTSTQLSRDRRRSLRSRPPVVESGATDEFPGLGRVEQIVLRGDGLTTTSLEILTGHPITVEVAAHWSLAVPGSDDFFLGTSLNYEDGQRATGNHLATARRHLATTAGEVLLVREVLLVGPDRTVHGSAEVLARLGEIPQPVAEALALTDKPIGRLLRDHGVQVTRELCSWGLMPAGSRAASLGAGLTNTSRVPGRTYIMRLSATKMPLAVLTERFAPHVFQRSPGR
jgi:chorismate-pyruvate lyase